VRPNIIISKAIDVNFISKELDLIVIVQEGGSLKAPLVLEDYGRDKVRCGVNKETNIRRADVK
jgi:hypothetical protein